MQALRGLAASDDMTGRGIRHWVSLACLGLTLGCAGTPFRCAEARQIRAGMTVEEVTSLLGPPNTVRSAAGLLTYVWVHVNTLAGTSRSLRVDFRDNRAIEAPVIPTSFQD